MDTSIINACPDPLRGSFIRHIPESEAIAREVASRVVSNEISDPFDFEAFASSLWGCLASALDCYSDAGAFRAECRALQADMVLLGLPRNAFEAISRHLLETLTLTPFERTAWDEFVGRVTVELASESS